MPTLETVAGPLGELRAASAAGGGTALSTTAVFVQIPNGAHQLFLTPRNFATAVVAQVALNPYLIVLKTADSLATASDYSANAQDASTSTKATLNSLPTAANGGYLYVGSHLPFRGVNVDVANTNSNASVLTVKYWNGAAWTDASATDGTAALGTTFAQDGNVTWTVPTDWAKASLHTINSPAPGAGVPQRSTDLYWTRWEVSAALDASTDCNSLLAMARSTAYFELVSAQTLELRVGKGPNGVGCVEAQVDAGTGNLIINVATRDPGVGFV